MFYNVFPNPEIVHILEITGCFCLFFFVLFCGRLQNKDAIRRGNQSNEPISKHLKKC
jgi:hypothetical protein